MVLIKRKLYAKRTLKEPIRILRTNKNVKKPIRMHYVQFPTLKLSSKSTISRNNLRFSWSGHFQVKQESQVEVEHLHRDNLGQGQDLLVQLTFLNCFPFSTYSMKEIAVINVLLIHTAPVLVQKRKISVTKKIIIVLQYRCSRFHHSDDVSSMVSIRRYALNSNCISKTFFEIALYKKDDDQT